ncbi:hypothetical protein HYW94_03725 [Candidatus Uhrbacteria bacterium]|nr:hypothetical protein [Candidatus Uhrbacteria bacterium]
MSYIVVRINFRNDLDNWMQAITKKQSHGILWECCIPIFLKEKMINKNNEEIAEIIESFLKEKYAVEDKALLKYAKHLEQILSGVSNKIFSIMERITEKSLYRNDFTGFITTFPRGPYNTESGYIWMIHDKDDQWQIGSFIHELLHMQFEYYYKDELLQIIDEEHFSFLRESMTVILNKEFASIFPIDDKGYPLHKEFRKFLLELWGQRKSFSQFVHEAAKRMPDRIISPSV